MTLASWGGWFGAGREWMGDGRASVVWKWRLPFPGTEPEPSQEPAQEAERATGWGISLCRQGAGFAWSLWEVTEAQQVDEVQDWEWECQPRFTWPVKSWVTGHHAALAPVSGCLTLPLAQDGASGRTEACHAGGDSWL